MLLGLTLAMVTGCAADEGRRIARADAGCPMSSTLVCETRMPGGDLDRCRCVRNKEIVGFSERY
jgi:hypothetical protein